MPRGTSRYNQPYSLKVTDFSDRELLAIASGLYASDGEVDISEVAKVIWPGTKKDADKLWHARHCVAIRFAYMRRMGVLEKIPGQHGKWELTDLGESVLNGHVSAAQRRLVMESKLGAEVSLMALIGDLYEGTNEFQATLMRREFQFRTHRRRWG